MSKLYTLEKYWKAIEMLAEKCELEVHRYEGDDEYTIGFKVFKRGGKKPIPVGMWPVTTRKNGRGNVVIESTEYLLMPVRNMPAATQAEFDAIIEMIP